MWGTPDQPFFAATCAVFLRYVQLPPQPFDAPTPWRFAQPGSLAAALQRAGFMQVQETAHTLPLPWPGPSEELVRALREMQAPLFRPVVDALDADHLAQAAAEMRAALQQDDDGQQVTTPVQVICGVGQRAARS